MSAEFPERVDAWLAWLLHNSGRAPATISKYQGVLDRLAKWYADPPEDPRLRPAGADPLNPTREDLERFTGMYAHSLKLTFAARRPMVSALRGFFAWLSTSAAGNGRNPAAVLPQPKAGRKLPRAMSLQDAERLLMQPDVGTFGGLRDAAILAMFIGGNFRASGLASLNESALIWYRDEAGSERLVVRVTEKGKRERLIPIPNEAAMLLRAYMGHEELAAIPRSLPDGDMVLFVTVRNRTIPECDYYGEARRITRRSLLAMLKRYAQRAGLAADVSHLHAMRHLYGAEMAEDDVPLLTAQELLGHADPKSTKIYSGLAHRKLRRVVDQSNPLAKMRTPLLESVRQLHRATSAAPAAPSDPAARQKPKTAHRGPL